MTEEEKAIATRAQSVFSKNPSLALATSGGAYSPWVAGIYFAHDGLALYTLLESSGKTHANLVANARVSFLVSENDAQKDFVQGIGHVQFLDETHAAAVRARLVAKLPWYQTYTPVVPLRIAAEELFVSSLGSGWFPAKRLNLR